MNGGATLAPLDRVQREILAAVTPLAPTDHALADALRLVLATDIVSPEAVPPFANTAMDGYAVRAADIAGATAAAPVRLRVVGDLPAGQASDVTVGHGEAIRIMTGAPMPSGADAVVMVERTTRIGDDGVAIETEARVGENVRDAGGDIEAGQTVFTAGAVVTPAHVGVLASIGVSHVAAVPRARVGVISTGDELVDQRIDQGPLEPGQIRDSNRPMLLALAREAGAEVVDLGHAPDDEDEIVAMLDGAFTRCDVVLTSGGVSVGDYDYVKSALDRFGALTWWQVAIKPAKPLAFGVVRGVPVFGLPGNPVSSLVSFELFARPALRKMMGHREWNRPEITARAEHEFSRRQDGKVHFDRVVVRRDGEDYLASRSGSQASNALSATAAANGLAVIPDGDGVPAGNELRVLLLDGPA